MEAAVTSVWSYQENCEQLKELLFYTTYQLETERAEAKEETKRNEANVNKLVHLLNQACRERDEAKNQLQRLLNKFSPSSPTENYPAVMATLKPKILLVNPTKGNSSITETDSVSETYNHHSYGSPPVDSIFDTVSSPELSNINVVDSSIVQAPQHVPHQPLHVPHQPFDQASLAIDNLVKGKLLPQKGKLLQSVMEAGPLLQTLLLAGPLPRWRNPPPHQTLQLPSLSVVNGSEAVHNSSSSHSYSNVSHGSAQIYSTSMLNFSSGHGTCISKAQVLSAGLNRNFINNSIPTAKRQRLH
ncbi:uncharacterized protein LOC113342994 [Papaver somniferum]|uniref:uncharacterized protein LOC113342994 n=1 Tax=Papaver somniferum TaxID=3469 RepID=UPI000E70337B|nr:uncharacterized protein LOC113342994 [Papaver somniferum]